LSDLQNADSHFAVTVSGPGSAAERLQNRQSERPSQTPDDCSGMARSRQARGRRLQALRIFVFCREIFSSYVDKLTTLQSNLQLPGIEQIIAVEDFAVDRISGEG